MKNYLLSLLFFIPFTFALVSCDKTHLSGGPLTLEEAIEKTKKDWDQFEIVWAWKDPVPANTQLRIVLGGGKEYEVSPNYEAWLIVSDMNQLANGGVHYRWYFVSVENGRVEFLDTTSEPLIGLEWSIEERELHIKRLKYIPPYGYSSVAKSVDPTMSVKSVSSTTNDWAVIISGGINYLSNWERYWNDCSWIYKTLRQVYGYSKSHIFTLISDGTDPGYDRNKGNGTYDSSPLDLDNDGLDDVQYSASLYNLNTVFTYLGNNVQSGDNVFIYVIDHGGYDTVLGSSFICLWNNECLYPSTLASWVSGINSGARIHFVLGQCKSGGFISALSGNNRSISTACTESQNSHGMSNGLFDEFVYYWTNAMAGWNPLASNTVNADDNHDGFVSFDEAYNYAMLNDSFRLSLDETPQYSSTPSLFGAHYDLNGNYSYLPFIQGGSEITSSYSNTYSLLEVPPGATPSWSISLGLTNISIGTGATQTISNVYSTLPYASAVLNMTCTSSGVTYTESRDVNLWVPGNHFNNSLISDYGNEFHLWDNPIGATNFFWDTDDTNLNIIQGGYIVPYYMNPGTDPSYTEVWVSFLNPLGESTTVVKSNY